MRKRFVVAGVVLVTVAAGATAALAAGWRSLNATLALPEQGAVFEVAQGAPLAAVTRELHERGVLNRPGVLNWYARVRGDATRIHAGEYLLKPGLTPLSLLDQLIRGDVMMHQFTVVEGWRFEDLLRHLRMHPAIAAGSLGPEEIMAALDAPGIHPEGQFLPDTYVFPRHTKDIDVLRWAHQALVETLDAAWANRSPDSVLIDPYEALILASIVEKETALASERKLIAGVFQERLARRMRLQTDPTVIYGLGSEYDGNLRRRDLARDTPYNTYTRAGLPPTPIALPGRDSIFAAAQPELSGALYFVATGEPDGSHRFSATLEEHNRAVADYLRRSRERANQ